MRIINIKYRVFTPDENQLLETAGSADFKYKYIPVVAYNTKSKDKADDLTAPKLLFINNDDSYFIFTLYELGTPMTLLKSYTGGGISAEDLRSVKEAFRKLKGVVSQCSERVVADLCCDIILKEINAVENRQKKLVFFIDRFNSDKMFGRLATLNLNLDRITIVFLTGRPTELMTTVMSFHTGKISFDICRLMHKEFDGEFVGPYPGDSQESLAQTYFFKPKPIASDMGSYRPLRLDIFTQGLSADEIYEKKELIRRLLVLEKNNINNNKNTETDPSTSEPKLLLPYGFHELDEKLDREKEKIAREVFDVKI